MKLLKPSKPDPDLDDDNSIEGERALSSVNKGITLQNRITNWTVVLFAFSLAGILLYKYYTNMFHEHRQQQATPRDTTHSIGATPLPPLVLPDVPVTSSAAAVASEPLPPLHPAASAVNAAPAGQPAPKTPAELLIERRLKPGLRFNLEGGSAAAAPPADPAGTPAQAGTPASTVKAAPASGFTAAHASLLPDPSLIMTRGKVIPCTIIPAIDTTLKGTVTCVTAEDVTGADNDVVLMERGTFCVGQQGGGVMQGQRRVGIIWQRCQTPVPNSVLVPLEADATDPLGRPGIPGAVENHFWDRFGAAIALSLVSDIGPYLVATRQGGGNNNTTVAFPNILNGPQELVGEVLKSTVNIPPTITAAQGARVLIFLNGDIDFRDVYQLERTK